ncbi:receptor-type tyrosine-protein phosphatase epsilon-like [Mytilus galloprovincialis]|uniref:receptor-type tyrosine-protein phosphatase epsilon-like n=1 Tax=Mytilus galloprovincialis TaxID=29158 RepID=UPI003F7BAE41
MKCYPGFTGFDVSAICTQTGNWSEVAPVCDRVKCGPIIKNISVSVVPEKSIYDYNETIRMSCKHGFDGEELIAVCSQTRYWSTSPPICKPLRCPYPRIPEHATRQIQELATYHYGDSVKFWCEHGYNLEGPGSAKCIVKDGSQGTVWNYGSQRCEGVLCLLPNVSDNNIIWDLTKTEYRYPDHINFDCVNGFELQNQTAVEIDCVVDENNMTSGKWKGDIPVCQAVKNAKQSNVVGPAVGGGIGTALVIIIIVIVIVIFMRRQKIPPPKNKADTQHNHSKLELTDSHLYSHVQERVLQKETKTENEVSVNNAYCNEIKEDTETGGYYAFNVGSQLPMGAIEVNNFYKYVEMGRGKEGNIEIEFQNLKSGLQKSTEAALKPGNRLKNKYKDMYAYDETRVILDKPKESHNSDYINASFILGYAQVRKYIAAQGPLDKTVDDFWRMVWQFDCGKIVMLTNVFENGKQKCIQYWPDHEQQMTAFGAISILLVKNDVYSDFTIRRLKLRKENETKTVCQFHFTAWPDKDVPKYASSLVHFRYKVNTTRTEAKGPLVVHCSAGVGRTGTYIALDYIVNEAKQRNYVEVFRSVEILRNQRVNMVQTANQYLFLHEAVLEALMCPNSGIPCRDFPNNYKDLMRFDNNKKKHKLQIEYELTNSISSRHDEEAFSKGKSEENRGKNRYSNIIPVGSEMPLLSTAVDGRNEYINAVFLPGYRNNQTFIVTQMPLETTVVDLWRLVYDYEIPTIVMLNKEIQKGKLSNVYWPEGNKDVTFGPFNITRTNTSDGNMYTCLDLTCKYKNQKVRQVKLFKAKFWEENMIVPGSANDMLSFLSATEDEHSNNRGAGPVLVHCLNGCDKSGLYCVLATVIERLRIEQDVDIQHIIKQMRNRRPQIIPNYEQFQFIYEAVIEYLTEFETYSNFQ